MKMAGITITKAENLLVRVESTDGTVGWGEAPSAPTMTGDTLGGLVAAVRDHLAPLLIGKDAANADHRPMLQRALVGNTGAHSAVEMALLDLAGRAARHAADRSRRPAAAPQRRADVAARQCDARSRTSPRRRPSRREGFNFFKLKIGVKPLARRDRGRACDPQGASRMRRFAPTPIAG